MAASTSLAELVAQAKVNAKTHSAHIAQWRADSNTGSSPKEQDLHDNIRALELMAVDVYGAFEARLQHHFKRGPFSRKLTALLNASGQSDLATRIHQYYLCINVLKHGKGASYRELMTTPSTLFTVTSDKGSQTGASQAPSSLVDISGEGFFDGLCAALLEAQQFLEAR